MSTSLNLSPAEWRALGSVVAGLRASCPDAAIDIATLADEIHGLSPDALEELIGSSTLSARTDDEDEYADAREYELIGVVGLDDETALRQLATEKALVATLIAGGHSVEDAWRYVTAGDAEKHADTQHKGRKRRPRRHR